MNSSLSPNLLKTMVDWVDLHIGLKVSEARLAEFEKGICLAAADSGFEEPQEYINELVRGEPKEHELGFLASYLTIGETYFFRDPLSFDLLSMRVLPERLEQGETVTIWSAGCATGEEPYSIAISALSCLKEEERRRLSIVATDINPRFLDVARQGLYRRWSFRDVPMFIKDRYFNLTNDDRYRLSEQVKALVRYNYLNLVSDVYPSAYTGTLDVDVIFCRNVLIYFSPEHVTEVLSKFHRCLKDGGYLFLAPSEIPHPAPDNFRLINMDGAIILRKESATSVHSSNIVQIIKSNYSYFGVSSQRHMKSFESLIEVSDGFSGTSPDLEGAVDAMRSTLRVAEHQRASLKGHDDDWPGTRQLESELPSDQSEIVASATRAYERGDYQEVVELVLEFPDLHQVEAEEPYLLLVRSYANLGNLDAALDWSERLISSQPINPRWYYLRATIQQELGEDGAATISLRQAIFLDPEYVLANFALGNIHRQSGNQSEAARYFNRVLQLLSAIDGASEIQDSDGLMAGQLMAVVKSLVNGGN